MPTPNDVPINYSYREHRWNVAPAQPRPLTDAEIDHARQSIMTRVERASFHIPGSEVRSEWVEVAQGTHYPGIEAMERTVRDIAMASGLTPEMLNQMTMQESRAWAQWIGEERDRLTTPYLHDLHRKDLEPPEQFVFPDRSRHWTLWFDENRDLTEMVAIGVIHAYDSRGLLIPAYKIRRTLREPQEHKIVLQFEGPCEGFALVRLPRERLAGKRAATFIMDDMAVTVDHSTVPSYTATATTLRDATGGYHPYRNDSNSI